MCLAIPVEIIEILDNEQAIANCGGIHKTIVTSLVDNVRVGDYVILHVGYALSKLDKEQAHKTLALLQEVVG